MYKQLHQYFMERTNISEEQFMKIKDYFKAKTLRRNEYLLRLGQTCKYCYFVNTGCLRFYTINEEGQELTRYFGFENKFATSFTSLISQKTSPENIQSIIQSEVLMISRRDFYHLVDTVPEVNIVYRRILEMAYIMSQERIYGFQGQSALERLRWLLDREPRILSMLSNKVVASYLGVTQYTLSRLKAEV
jgi:CRP-like cAMP-binding protein